MTETFVDDYTVGFQDGKQDAERGMVDPALYYGADDYARGYKVGFNAAILSHLRGAHTFNVKEEDLPDNPMFLRAGEKIREGSFIWMDGSGHSVIQPAEDRGQLRGSFEMSFSETAEELGWYRKFLHCRLLIWLVACLPLWLAGSRPVP